MIYKSTKYYIISILPIILIFFGIMFYTIIAVAGIIGLLYAFGVMLDIIFIVLWYLYFNNKTNEEFDKEYSPQEFNKGN